MNDISNSPSIGALSELAAYQLRRAQIGAFNAYNKVLSEFQITPGQFGVITLIGNNEGLSQSAVARALGVERSTMVAVIDGLEDRGLVCRRPSKVDRRSNALELSNNGRALLENAIVKINEADAQITSELSDAERATLLELLKRISSSY